MSLIQISDYNTLVSQISNIYGIGGNSYGYNGNISLNGLSNHTNISHNEWVSLRNYLILCNAHQNDTVVGNSTTNGDLLIPVLGTTITNDIISQYSYFINQLINNRFNLAVSNIHTTSQTISSYTNSWNNVLEYSISFTGGSSGLGVTENIRLFFNTGGTISFIPSIYAPPISNGHFIPGNSYKIINTNGTDFTTIGALNNNTNTIFIASNPGTGTGTGTAYLVKNEDWVDLCNISLINIGATGNGGDMLLGWYDLDITEQLVYKKTSTAFPETSLSVYANTNDDRSILFISIKFTNKNGAVTENIPGNVSPASLVMRYNQSYAIGAHISATPLIENSPPAFFSGGTTRQYAIIPSSNTVSINQSISFGIYTQYVPNSTRLYWQYESINAPISRFTNNKNIGFVDIPVSNVNIFTNNISIAFSLLNDQINVPDMGAVYNTYDEQSFKIGLYSDQSYKQWLCYSPTIVIPKSGSVIFTKSGTHTVPDGVKNITVHARGGSGGTGGSDSGGNGAVGANGRLVVNTTTIASPGDVFAITVGTSGGNGSSGGGGYNGGGGTGYTKGGDGGATGTSGWSGGGAGGGVSSAVVNSTTSVIILVAGGGGGGGGGSWGVPPSSTPTTQGNALATNGDGDNGASPGDSDGGGGGGGGGGYGSHGGGSSGTYGLDQGSNPRTSSGGNSGLSYFNSGIESISNVFDDGVVILTFR